MTKNKRDLLISNILILIALIWLSINNSSFLEVLILFSVFGIIGSIGAAIIDLKLPNINRFAKYLINTLWGGIFIALYVVYLIFINDKMNFLSTEDKVILVFTFSLIAILFSFVLQYVFFVISFILITKFKSKN